MCRELLTWVGTTNIDVFCNPSSRSGTLWPRTPTPGAAYMYCHLINVPCHRSQTHFQHFARVNKLCSSSMRPILALAEESLSVSCCSYSRSPPSVVCIVNTILRARRSSIPDSTQARSVRMRGCIQCKG